MKKFFTSIAIFLPVSIFCYVTGVIVWGFFMPILFNKNLVYPYQGYGNMYTRLQEAKTMGKVNYLFIGSSHAYRGFDTRNFNQQGRNAFNLGSNSQTPVQTEWLLEQYLAKLDPDTVIIEVYPGVFELDGTESTLDILANEKFSLHSGKLASKTLNIKVVNALILSAFQTILKPNSFSGKETLERPEGKYITGGYVELGDSTFRHTKYSQRKNWKLLHKQLAALERITNKLKERNVAYLLVQAPITRSLYDSYSNNDYFDNEMYKLGNYINFNGQLPLDDSIHFYDNNHLNKEGVNLFNRGLLEALQKDKKP